MAKINFVNRISIKNKTYLLVLLGVMVALVLLFVSNNGLDAIRTEQNNLIFSTDIERYTNKLILEEQKYRLNTNGSVYNLAVAHQSYEHALNYVDKIYQTLNKTDNLNDSSFLLKNSQKTRRSTDEYKNLYMQGVKILTELNQQATILETEGEFITLMIQEYVEAKRKEIKRYLSHATVEKINNGSNIWQYTYVTRLHEKKYRLSPDDRVLEDFKADYKFMMSEWERLKKMSDQAFEIEKLDAFNVSSKKYKTAMLRWVELNRQLVTEILPKMKELGNSVISSAIQSAKLSVKQMSDKRNNIALTLLLVSIFTITLGIIIGTMIARSISSPLEKLKAQALAISDGKYEARIEVTSKDEIGRLAEAFNYMSATIASEMAGREQAEKAQRRSQKMDAIGQLTGGIAHDFNNILGIILGNLELLESLVGNDEESLQRIQVIEKAGLRATALTRQLLSFSRSEATQVSTVNINLAINEMTEIVKRSLTPEIEVKYILCEELWSAEIDNGDFCDALLNLCINARDSITGHGALTIETKNVSLDENFCRQNHGVTPGQYIEFAVGDTGEGIPDELKERIFEPFFTTKEQGKGTGLGLAMVYAFVSRSNGFIKCDSEVGVGTTFHIYLPKKNGEQAIEQTDDTQSGAMPVGNETILVVDDEESLRELTRNILEAQGYRILTASDGRQALQKLVEHPEIDLLFSDIVMPNGMNGYERAEQASVLRKNIKILFTSGFAEKAESRSKHKHINASIFNKPYNRADLIRKIRATLDQT
jgi:signal transduction histidine kinase/ActR/RegA family two-component response regulator